MSGSVLTAEQKALRADAAQYATKYLVKAFNIHSFTVWPRHTHQRERYELIRPLYRTAAQYGLLKCQIPQKLGGTGSSTIDAAVAFEEMYAVDSSVTLSVAATGLGLLPLILGGTAVQQKKFLQPFIAGKGEPVASLVHSEPAGTAGWLNGKGLQTTARREGGHWVVNGAKEGNLNTAGWDRAGADLLCVVCRAIGPAYTDISSSPRESTLVLLVTRDLIAANRQRDRSSWEVLSEPELPAHPAVSGPHLRLSGFRVPADDGLHVLAGPEAGAQLVERCLAHGAALAGAFAVSVTRHAWAAAERAARLETRGLDKPLGEVRGVARDLGEMRRRVGMGREVVWKALRELGEGSSDGSKGSGSSSYAAMLRNRDDAVSTVADAMRIVGPLAARADQPFAQWLVIAANLPLIDCGVWTMEGEHAVRAGDDIVNGTQALAL